MANLIRYATLEDATILGTIHSESSLLAFKDIIPEDYLTNVFSTERRTNCFVRELSELSPKTAIAFINNEPAGLLSFGKSRVNINDHSLVEIWRVYILPKFWGSAISKELIQWGINEIHNTGMKKIELWVLEENMRARKFYEKMGFKNDNVYEIIDSGKELKELRYIYSP